MSTDSLYFNHPSLIVFLPVTIVTRGYAVHTQWSMRDRLTAAGDRELDEGWGSPPDGVRDVPSPRHM